MRNLPRITIVTPSYNQAPFIRQTVESVLSQDYPNLEYIVMDGGSTDGTVEILKEYGERLAWSSERDHGQAHAINKGLRLATGEVVAYLNSDDLLEPGALHRVGRYFAQHPDAAWVTGKCHIIDPQGHETRKAITLYKNLWLYCRTYSLLLVLNYISQPATFWRSDLLRTLGYFDESLHYTMDYDYWLRAGRTFKLHFLPRYIASFRVHASSKGSSSAHAQFDSELAVAKRYMRSRVLTRLHKLHAQLILAVYKHVLGRAQLRQVS
jgi:glycosyltransferase involved in cell wall biosynthesis